MVTAYTQHVDIIPGNTVPLVPATLTADTYHSFVNSVTNVLDTAYIHQTDERLRRAEPTTAQKH